MATLQVGGLRRATPPLLWAILSVAESNVCNTAHALQHTHHALFVLKNTTNVNDDERESILPVSVIRASTPIVCHTVCIMVGRSVTNQRQPPTKHATR